MTAREAMRPSSAGVLSIVIPVGAGDSAWVDLLPLLLPACPVDCEVLLSAAEPRPASLEERSASESGPAIRWLRGTRGRGAQLNRGARAATGEFLWFLHADSRPGEDAIPVLLRRLRSDPGALWYFDLRFLHDGPRAVKINEFGALIRSRVLGLPFGDQGFAMSRRCFEQLGGYSETTAYGEDHLLVWAARHAGVPVRPVGLPLLTSARKYARQGWLITTLRHLRLTWRQAVPELLRSARPQGAPS